MAKITKKIISFLMALAMVVTLLPAQSMTAMAATYDSQATVKHSQEDTSDEATYDVNIYVERVNFKADTYGFDETTNTGRGVNGFFPLGTIKIAQTTVDAAITDTTNYGQYKDLTDDNKTDYKYKDSFTQSSKNSNVDADKVFQDVSKYTIKKEDDGYHLDLYLDAKVADPENSIEEETVPVAVYVTDGSTSFSSNTSLMSELGLSYVQPDQYAPVGVIYLPTSIFEGKTSPYIKSKDDWTTVKNAIEVIDKSYLTSSGEANKNNKIDSKLDKVCADINYKAATHKTALFDWNWNEAQGAISLINGKYYKYHLDLRLNTAVLTYKYYDGKTLKDTQSKSYWINDNVTVDTTDFANIPNGYAVAGVYTDANFTTPYTGGTITEDTTVYVKLTKKSYTVSFDPNGGSINGSSDVVKKENVGYGSYANALGIGTPEKAGYNFKGWSTTKDGNNIVDLSQTSIKANTTFYAVWELGESTYKVTTKTENLDGIYTETTVEKKDTTDSTINVEEDATKNAPEGFVLDKENSKLEGTASADGKTEIVIVYKRATYTVSYSVTYPSDFDGTKANTDALKMTEVKYGDTVKVAAKLTAKGYDFIGWSVASGSSDKVTDWNETSGTFTIKGDVTLTGKFTEKGDTKYTVKYMLADLSKGDGSETTYTEDEDLRVNGTGTTGTTVPVNVKTITGFKLDTSKTAKNYESTKIKADGTTEVTLYYSREKYKVTYNISADSETGLVPEYDTSKYVNAEYEYGAQISLPENPSADGYYFTYSNWDNIYQTMPAKDLIFNGSWMAKTVDYTITYYLENASDGGYTTQTVTKQAKVGTEVTLTDADKKSIDGYHIDNENTNNVTEATVTADGANLAIYYNRDTYTVSYELDGTIPTDAEAAPGVGTYKWGQTINIAEAPAEVKGYTFSGWNVTEAGLTDYDSVKGTATVPQANVTITGTWSANTDTAYTIQYYTEDIKKGSDGKATYSLNDSYTDTSHKGTTGETVDATKVLNGNYPSISGFTIDTTINEDQHSGTIAGDGSLVLKLYYARNAYYITYQLDDQSGNNITVDPGLQRYGETLQTTTPTVPDGYVFDGWYTDSSYTTKVLPTDKMPLNGITLYGKIVPREDMTYTVEYYFEDLNGDYVKDDSIATDVTKNDGVTGSEVSADKFQLDSDKTTGFSYNAEKSQSIDSVSATAGENVVKVYYSRNSYTLTYSYSGNAPTDATALNTEAYNGTNNTGILVKYGQEVTVAPAASAEGYTFSGWTVTGGDAATSIADGKFTMPATVVTLGGTFTANTDTKYTVYHILQPMSGDYPSTDSLDNAYVEVLGGTTDTEAIATARAYDNYHVNDTKSVTKGTITADGKLALYVYYDIDVKKIHVTDEDGKAIDGVTDKDVKVGDTIKDKLDDKDAPAKPGYDFDKWVIVNPDGTTSEITDDTKMPAGDITIKPEYKAQTLNYKIEYYQQKLSDDGTDASNDYELVKTDTKQALMDTVVTLNPSDYDKSYEGFKLNTEIEGTVLSNTVTADGNMTLKLYYDRNLYTVKYEVSGKLPSEYKGSKSETVTVPYGATITIKDAPSSTGFTFTGSWADNGGKQVEVTGDVSYTGSFAATGDTTYTVIHKFQNIDDTSYDADGNYVGSDNYTDKTFTYDNGKAEESTTATPLTGEDIAGFTYNATLSEATKTLGADGKTELVLYYTRNVHTVTVKYQDGAGNTLHDSASVNVPFGGDVQIATPAVSGYTPNYRVVTVTDMPDKDYEVIVTYTANPVSNSDNSGNNGNSGNSGSQSSSSTTPDMSGIEQPIASTATVPFTITTAVAADGVPVVVATPEVAVEDESVPAGAITTDDNGGAVIQEITDEETPLASGVDEGGSAWALINLISAIITVIIALILLIQAFRKKDEEDEEQMTEEEKEEQEDEKKRRRRKLLGLIPAIVAVIAFILTENIFNPMAYVDKWTILMIILLVVELLVCFFTRKKDKDEKPDDGELHTV